MTHPTEHERIHPVLTAEQLDTVMPFGERRPVDAGEDLFCAEDPGHDLFVVLSGLVGVVSHFDGGEELVIHHTAGEIVGELDLLTGQRTYLGARMLLAGEVLAISEAAMRRLLATAPGIGDLVVEAFVVRREQLLTRAIRSLVVAGPRLSARSLALREYLSRNRLPHLWVDDPTDVAPLQAAHDIADAELPVAVIGATVIPAATPGAIADHLGLTARALGLRRFDLVVVGGGPAGLAAAVYGASEGLDTLTIEAIAPGGQAGTSSRIENYLGFPTGLSGTELTDRATTQALRFGARFSTPCKVRSLAVGQDGFTLTLADDTAIEARAIVAATGARYRRLPVARLAELEGSCVYYSATEVEARLVAGSSVVVVGGGNSAGQAALFLARSCRSVILVVRGTDLRRSMSSYLAERIQADPMIEVRLATQVAALHGDDLLRSVTLTGATVDEDVEATALFSFIGAEPSAEWLEGHVDMDGDGFVQTCRDLAPDGSARPWRGVGRIPLPYETSQPGLFAVGDVRSGSIKRVAAAVGEGSAVVRSVHEHLRPSRTGPAPRHPGRRR